MNLEVKKDKMQFATYKDLMMYYHTTIRNVALTTAVSFAALGYSRFYRGKSKLYTIGMIAVSLMILTCSVLLNLLLYTDLQKYVNLDEYTNIQHWLTINKIFMVVHLVCIFFAIYTFYRINFGKQFK